MDPATNLPALGPFLVYRNVGLGVVMKYPAAWQKEEKATPVAFALALSSPAEGPPGQFRENVALTIQPLLVRTKLESVVEFGMRITQDRFQVVSSSPATLANIPAQLLTYTGSLGPQFPQLKISTLFAVRDLWGYTFSYTARVQKFDYYVPFVQQMVESLDIL